MVMGLFEVGGFVKMMLDVDCFDFQFYVGVFSYVCSDDNFFVMFDGFEKELGLMIYG